MAARVASRPLRPTDLGGRNESMRRKEESWKRPAGP
jgi:hypothetical protein